MKPTTLAAVLALLPALASAAPSGTAKTPARGFRMAVEGSKDAPVTEKDITGFTLERQGGKSVMTVVLSAEGSSRLARLTGSNQGKKLAVYVSGRKVNEPPITTQIAGPRVAFPDLTDSAVIDLVRVLLKS